MRHRNEHLAVVFRLAYLGGAALELGQLGHSVDQLADVIAEEADNLPDGGGSVFHGVVEHARRHSVGVLAQNGENTGNFEGMGYIGLTREPGLAPMDFRRVNIGAHQEIRVVRCVLLHQIDDVHDPGRGKPFQSGGHRATSPLEQGLRKRYPRGGQSVKMRRWPKRLTKKASPASGEAGWPDSGPLLNRPAGERR